LIGWGAQGSRPGRAPKRRTLLPAPDEATSPRTTSLQWRRAGSHFARPEARGGRRGPRGAKGGQGRRGEGCGASFSLEGALRVAGDVGRYARPPGPVAHGVIEQTRDLVAQFPLASGVEPRANEVDPVREGELDGLPKAEDVLGAPERVVDHRAHARNVVRAGHAGRAGASPRRPSRKGGPAGPAGCGPPPPPSLPRDCGPVNAREQSPPNRAPVARFFTVAGVSANRNAGKPEGHRVCTEKGVAPPSPPSPPSCPPKEPPLPHISAKPPSLLTCVPRVLFGRIPPAVPSPPRALPTRVRRLFLPPSWKCGLVKGTPSSVARSYLVLLPAFAVKTKQGPWARRSSEAPRERRRKPFPVSIPCQIIFLRHRREVRDYLPRSVPRRVPGATHVRARSPHHALLTLPHTGCGRALQPR